VEKVGLEFGWLHPGQVVEASVLSAAFLSFAFLCNGSEALARNPRDALNQFSGTSQSVVVTKAIQAEWRKSPDVEITCVEQDLRPGGASISALLELGISTFDGGVARDRASCRIQMAQSVLPTRLTSAPTDPFSVDGWTLGSKMPYGNPAYQQYQCVPSQKFDEFVWCTKTISDKEPRGRFRAWFSMLRAEDGAVVYANRYQEPAYWSANEVADDIQRYSHKFGQEPHIIQLPVRPGLPKGTLATWGKVVLELIAGDELRLLGEDKPLKKGIAIDFIGNFTQSARQGLPIYRLAGGPGFVWAASYNQSGRGTLRFSAVDASTYSPQSLPSPTTPPPVAADPLGGAATAVDAQPIFSPSMTKSHSVEATASPHRGDHLDCTAAPNCGAATPALSSLVAVRDPDDVIAQVLNYSAKRLQQANPADGAGEYGRESAASNFRSRDRIWLDTVVTYWVWLILALIAGGPAGYWLIRLQIARVRGSAEEARRAAEATGSEKARRAAEEQAAEDVRRAAEEQAAEDARRAAEEQAAEDAHRAAEEQAAEHARRAAEEQAAENAHRAAEEQAAEHARRAAEEQAAENARSAAEVKAAEDIRRFAKAKGTEGAAGVSKAKAVAKTKPSGGARSAAKAKAAKKAGGAAAEEAPRNAKRSTAAIRLGRNPERLAAPDEPLPPVVV
jgi:hypothetical protein